MIAMHNKDKSFEAAVKYFAIGALAAGFYAFGAMILYGLTGTVEIDKIAEVLAARNFEPMGYIVLGSLMIFVTLAFKMALVPFHTWAPDVYEGSSAALAGYMAAIPKVAVFVVTIRLFEMLVHANIVWVEYVLYASVVLTMTLANIWALVQKDVKRMLAYSSISHAGFVLAAILIGTTQANSALFFYWILFTFASLGSFAMLWLSHQKTIPSHWTSDYPFEKFQGLMHTLPMAALMMGIFMFALAGIPPFSLFFGKMYLIGAAVSAGEIVLALIMALNSALAAYYYLKLVIYMFLKEPLNKDKSVYMMNSSLSLKTIIGVSVFLTTFAFIWANDILEFVTYYVYVSGY
jgi:NADH-quinone oxidoreductase subunit N